MFSKDYSEKAVISSFKNSLLNDREDCGLTVGEQSDSGRNLVELVDLLHCLCLEIRNLYLCLSDIIYIFIYIY